MSKGLFKIYVGNLDYKVTEFAVRRLFEPFGELEDVAMATDKQTGIAPIRPNPGARSISIFNEADPRFTLRFGIVNMATAARNHRVCARPDRESTVGSRTKTK